MSALELLLELRKAGFRLWVAEGRLWVQPAPKLTAEQRQDITTHRNELLDLLAWEAAPVLTPATIESWLRLDPAQAARTWGPLEPKPVSAGLATWFTAALEDGRLPGEPFGLDLGIWVEEPAGFYAWILERIASPGGRALAEEAEGYIRRLQEIVEDRS